MLDLPAKKMASKRFCSPPKKMTDDLTAAVCVVRLAGTRRAGRFFISCDKKKGASAKCDSDIQTLLF
jgi:hypothetical protein